MRAEITAIKFTMIEMNSLKVKQQEIKPGKSLKDNIGKKNQLLIKYTDTHTHTHLLVII